MSENTAPYTAGTTRIITPKVETIDLILTAKGQGISHHDPSMSDGSNTVVFRRQPKLIPVPKADIVESKQMQVLYDAFPAPEELAEMMAEFTPVQFVATALIYQFLETHNTSTGIGNFDNKSKFVAFQKRAKQCAVKTHTCSGFWDALVKSMGVEYKQSKGLLLFFSIPKSVQFATLGYIAMEPYSVVEIARFWHDKTKTLSIEYAEMSGQEQSRFVPVEPKGTQGDSEAIRLDLPAISSNSLRHQFRIAAMEYMMDAIDIRKAKPGWGELPAMVEAMFVNGGNIIGGSKAPTNAPQLSADIRHAYPPLDLFSGTTASFWLGKSAADVVNWLICRENADCLPDLPPDCTNIAVSAFDMLHEQTETRHATERGDGQMIQNFETLINGVQFFVRISLSPDTCDRTRGALISAVEWFRLNIAKVGGQSSRGYGIVDVQVLKDLNDRDRLLKEYDDWLRDEKGAIRHGLVSGELGTGSVVAP